MCLSSQNYNLLKINFLFRTEDNVESIPISNVKPLFLHLQVLSAATVVAKHTSALCNACRLASSKTDNPVAKRHFVQSAKDVANSTANLVKAIKVWIGLCS